jgi:hypothetical protein
MPWKRMLKQYLLRCPEPFQDFILQKACDRCLNFVDSIHPHSFSRYTPPEAKDEAKMLVEHSQNVLPANDGRVNVECALKEKKNSNRTAEPKSRDNKNSEYETKHPSQAQFI